MGDARGCQRASPVASGGVGRVVACIVWLAACGSPAGDSVDGAQIFASTCAMCHGPNGKPDAAMVARLAVHDLTAPEFRARVTAELVEHQVRTGSKNRVMPAFELALSDAQITAVAAYVAGPGFVATAPK